MGDTDHLMRLAAFEHVKRLSDTRDRITAVDLAPGFIFQGERIPPEKADCWSKNENPTPEEQISFLQKIHRLFKISMLGFEMLECEACPSPLDALPLAATISSGCDEFWTNDKP